MTDKATKLSEGIAYFMGTENYWRHPLFKRFVYTDGVKFIAETAGAYWLIDAIFSHQVNPKVIAEGFQSWHLKQNDDGTWRLWATDGGKGGNDPQVIAEQKIEFSDFPLPEISFYLTDKVLMHPNEY